MNGWYPSAKAALLAGQVDFTGGAVKMLLVSASYTRADTDEVLSDIPGGAVVAGPVPVSVTAVTGGVVTVGDVTFPLVAGADVAGAVVYQDSGSPSTSLLLGYLDERTDTAPFVYTPNGGDILVEFLNNRMCRL